MARSRDIWAEMFALFQACARGEINPEDAFDDFMWRHRGKRPRIPTLTVQIIRRERFLGHTPTKVDIVSREDECKEP